MKLFFCEPQFFPPLEFYFNLLHSDLWIVLDHVPYEVRTRQNRCRIRTPLGVQLLTVGVKRPCNGKPYYQIMIDNYPPWKRTFLKAIEYNYKNTPYYHEYIEEIKYYINAPNILLETLNISTTCWVSGLLHKHLQPFYTKSVCQNPDESVIEAICEKLNGTPFTEPFVHPRYQEKFEPFEKDLSVLDALFNIGAEATKELLNAKR